MKPVKSFSILNHKIVIKISNEGLQGIRKIVSLAPQETQWFHTIDAIEKTSNSITLSLSTELYIPKQNTSATQVDTSSSMMIEFYNELKDRYNDQEVINNKLNSMNCWCHSHVNMAPNPSGQDVSQFATFVNSNLTMNNANWQIMLIFNKRDEYYSRVYDPNTGIVYEGVPILVVDNYDLSYIEEAVKTKLVKPVFTSKGWPAKTQKSFNFTYDQKVLSNDSEDNFFDDSFSNSDLSVSLLEPILKTLNVSPSSKLIVLTHSFSQYLISELEADLDEKELVWFFMFLLGHYNDIPKYFTEKGFMNLSQEDFDGLKGAFQLKAATGLSKARLLDALEHAITLSELSTVKEVKKYLKDLLLK